MPNSLQYPLERQRDVQRRWNQLLQRTVARKEPVAEHRRLSPSSPPFGWHKPTNCRVDDNDISNLEFV